MRLARDELEVLLVVGYVLAVTLTTAISGAFGPLASVIDSLPGIGLVIVIRGELHEIWRGVLWRRMLPLVVLGGIGSLTGNLLHPRIAAASFVAFSAANLVAAWSYDRSRVGSVVAFAVVDSLVFAPLAFGALTLWVVSGQIAAKILGAGGWFLLLRAVRRNRGLH
jgi:hypothetical protein